jgi:hypothetical protein
VQTCAARTLLRRIGNSIHDMHNNMCPQAELVFVDLLRSPGIDSQPGGTVRQPYLSYRPDRLHRLAKSIPRNRSLGSINVYKYGLSILLHSYVYA